jgi:type IV pilus assembly protein PilO
MADLSLTKLNWKAQLVVFLLLSIGIAGAYVYLVDGKERAEIDTQRRELANIRGRINKGLTAARELPNFRKEVDQLQLRLDALRPILPEEKDVGDLLRRIQTLASQSNLTILGFKPLPTNQQEMHAEWPITLELEGNYHSLGLFLDRVSKFPRIINVSKLDVKGKQNPTAAQTIDVTCTATTFVLAEAAPGETTGKKKGAAKAAPKKTE